MDTSSKRRHGGLLVVKIAVGVVLAAGTALAASPAMAAAPAVAAASGATVTPQVTVADCNDRTDYLELWKLSGEELCFANAGDLDVAVYDVDHLESGNNAGWVRYIAYNGHTYQQSFAKFSSIHIGGEVTHIHII